MKSSFAKMRLKAVDALGRAITATKQSQRLCTVAAEAFSNEGEVLREVKGMFEAMKT